MEPIPTKIPDELLSVQFLAMVYGLLTFGITAVLVWLWIPVELAVITLLAVGGILLVIFWPLFRRSYPEGFPLTN